MTEFIAHWKDLLTAFVMSMLPVIELRGGIAYAALKGIPFPLAAAVCYVGNMLPIPFILLFLNRIFLFLERFGWSKKIVDWLDKHARKKSAKVKTAMWWALVIFTAIPLPGTGAWTASLIAVVFDVPPRKALPAVALGVVGALCIMSALFYLAPSLFTRFVLKG